MKYFVIYLFIAQHHNTRVPEFWLTAAWLRRPLEQDERRPIDLLGVWEDFAFASA